MSEVVDMTGAKVQYQDESIRGSWHMCPTIQTTTTLYIGLFLLLIDTVDLTKKHLRYGRKSNTRLLRLEDRHWSGFSWKYCNLGESSVRSNSVPKKDGRQI